MIFTTQEYSLKRRWTPECHGNLYSLFFIVFSFSVNYYFSVIFFSTPPGVCQNKKSPSHFHAHLVDRAGFEPAAFRSSQAERLCEPNVLRPKHALPGIPG